MSKGFIIYAIIASTIIYFLSLPLKDVSFGFWIVCFGCMLFTFVVLPGYVVYKGYKETKSSKKEMERYYKTLENQDKENQKNNEREENVRTGFVMSEEDLESKRKKECEEQEKLEYWKDNLLYDKYFYIILLGISNIPFHYENIFKSNISNKFDLIKSLLDELFKRLPKEYNLQDIKKLTTYRKLALICSEVLQPYIKEKLEVNRFYYSIQEVERYSDNPNRNILDDLNENAFLLSVETCYNFENVMNAVVNSRIQLIQAIEKNRQDAYNKANNPKYSYDKCMNLVSQYNNEINFYILKLYYEYAICIIYYIYVSKTISKIENESELFQLYEKLKNEIHSNSYIIEKLFPIYNSLYKKDFDVTFETEDEFRYLIEVLESKQNMKENKKFVNIDESILNLNYESFTNVADDSEVIFKIVEQISEKLSIYRKNVTFDDVFSIFFYQNRFIEYLEKVKENRAIYEKNRIMNGNFAKEEKVVNDLLDYSNISNGYEFESFVANIYKMLGYTVIDITSKSGDQGADVIIEKDNIKYAIQVKYYNNPVGNKAVQEVVAAKNFYKTDKAMVVTNSTFTPQAITLSIANDVLLVDGSKLDDMIKEIKKKK